MFVREGKDRGERRLSEGSDIEGIYIFITRKGSCRNPDQLRANQLAQNSHERIHVAAPGLSGFVFPSPSLSLI